MERVADALARAVADALGGAGSVASRPMFGGLGLYHDGLFFALVFRDRLYFKVDERSRGAFEARGAEPFRPPRGASSLAYYEVPARVIEDARGLRSWAQQALDAARASPRKKRARTPAALADLGPVARRRLADVGIATRADLERVGSVAAFLAVRANGPRASASLLYALEAALRGLRPDVLSEDLERDLRRRAGLDAARPRARRTRPRGG